MSNSPFSKKKDWEQIFYLYQVRIIMRSQNLTFEYMSTWWPMYVCCPCRDFHCMTKRQHSCISVSNIATIHHSNCIVLHNLRKNATLFLRVFFLDKCINMYENVTSVCWAAYYHLKNIHCLKAFLTQEALVTSHIDYCSSILYGISHYNINRLQWIQNSADKYSKNMIISTQFFKNYIGYLLDRVSISRFY